MASESRGQLVRRLDTLLKQLTKEKENYSRKPDWLLNTGDLETLRNEVRYCLLDVGSSVQNQLREISAMDFTKFKILDAESHKAQHDSIDSRIKLLDADSERQCIGNLGRLIELIEVVRNRLARTSDTLPAVTPSSLQAASKTSESVRDHATMSLLNAEKAVSTRDLVTLLKRQSLTQPEAAVQRGLRTWRGMQETETALIRVIAELPGPLVSRLQLTNWQARARQEASGAISKLSDGASFEAKLAAARAAVQKVTREFEEHNLRQKITDEAILLPLLSAAEQEDARAAIRASVHSSLSGASEAELRRARQITLRPFEEVQRQREERQRLERKVDQGLAHIHTFLDQLWNNSKLEGFENYSEVWRYADEIRQDVRDDLLEELNGKQDVSDYRIRGMIEASVDELLSD